MNIVKVTFGFMMLVVALVFIERLMENLWTNLAWAVLGLSTFGYFHVMNQGSAVTLWKGVRTVIIFLGLFASAMYGYHTLFPASHSSSNAQHQGAVEHAQFVIVKDLGDFEAKLAKANAEGKSVMIDLYADWCVACKEFEKYTFPDPDVNAALSNTVLMQIDLTDNTPEAAEFWETFDILGLPTIMFFGTDGKEIDKARVTGFMRAEPFAAHVNSALK